MRGVDREYKIWVGMGRLGALYPFARRAVAGQVLSGRMKARRNHVRITGSNDLAPRILLPLYEIQQ